MSLINQSFIKNTQIMMEAMTLVMDNTKENEYKKET
jgi:hypothetical protein